MTQSPVLAETLGAAANLRTGTVEHSQVALEANSERANARGNDHLASLSTIESGGGIAVLQSATASQVRAAQSGTTTLFASDATGSTLAIAGNRQQTDAVTNAAAATLVANGATPISADGVPTTSVDSAGTVIANATQFVAQRQISAGPTIASTGASIASGSMLDVGELTDGMVSVDDNLISASATANQVASTLSVAVLPVAGFGNLAASLTAQQLDGQVLSTTIGRAQIHIAAPALTSVVTASGNDVRSDASGNVADTVMRVQSPVIVTGGLPGSGPVGTAMVSGDETRTTTAAIAAHTDQKIGSGSISANVTRSDVSIGADGAISGSSIVAAGNAQLATAAGNDATTRLTLSAPVFVSSADLLVSQTSEAGISTAIGDPSDPAGVTITPSGTVSDSQLRIAGNSVQALAVGNRTASTLALDTATASDGGRHALSRAGTLDYGHGASATLALSSVQKIGMLGAAPVISSLAIGQFSAAGAGRVSSSTVVIDKNVQTAAAVANTGDNSLTLSGSTLGNTGTALDSSQFGAATLSATASARIPAPGTTERSTVAITSNVNQATAALNEVTNRLSVHAAQPSDGPLTSVSADNLGQADSEGSNLLNNAQFAMGRSTATARTLLGGCRCPRQPAHNAGDEPQSWRIPVPSCPGYGGPFGNQVRASRGAGNYKKWWSRRFEQQSCRAVLRQRGAVGSRFPEIPSSSRPRSI